MKPEVGQIWKENDPRFENQFKLIVDTDNSWLVRIRSCDVNGIPLQRAPARWAKLDRFNGLKMGYSFVKIKEKQS